MRWWTGTWLTHYFGSKAASDEDTLDVQENWVNKRLCDGKAIIKFPPVFGKLIIKMPDKPEDEVERIIIPENAISRTGYVNEIWVPGFRHQIHVNEELAFGIVHYLPTFPAYCTIVEVCGHPYKGLLLSPKKLTITPYLRPDRTKSIANEVKPQR